MREIPTQLLANFFGRIVNPPFCIEGHNKNMNFIKITETRGQLGLEGINFVDHCRINGSEVSNVRQVVFNDPELGNGRDLIECR